MADETNEYMLAQIFDEIQTLKEFDSDHILKFLDDVVVTDSSISVILEFVDGVSLRQLIENQFGSTSEIFATLGQKAIKEQIL